MAMIKKRRKAKMKPEAKAVNSNGEVTKLKKKVSRMDALLTTVVDKLQNFYVVYVIVFGLLAIGSCFGIGVTSGVIAEQSNPHGFFIFTAVMATISTTAIFVILAIMMGRAHDKLAEEANKAVKDNEEE